MRGAIDRIHERHRQQRQQKIADLRTRFLIAQQNYFFGDSLLQLAIAHGDTAAIGPLRSNQAELMLQLRAMSDTATKLAH
ncbi:MAG: hypothetical protein H0U66_06615 [Gemmatimonadaceae bacterium]|nr:hypothetical protein [Gemmatimonadaceae bacterium]